MLSVVAVCVNNPDRSSFAIYRRDTAPTPAGFAEKAETTEQSTSG
jgi:hypothetical protein